MKTIMKRTVAYMLTAAVCLGMFPGTVKKVEAASSSVSLACLGSLGSLSVGSKTKSGKWWMMKIEGEPAFCLDLGYTCHSGDTYQDSSHTYTNESSGTDGKKGHIGYWYDTKMKKSRKAYVMSQALFWALEEGETSETELKAVINKVKSNTGSFSKSAAELYTEIFENEDTYTVKVKQWTYSGSGSHRQKLLQIDSKTTPKLEEGSVSTHDYYRQRIKIHKVDEDGKPMQNARFTIKADNIDELYSWRINGTTSDVDEDITSFVVDTVTDEQGWINLRLTYQLFTDDYFYIADSSLSGMSADAKKKKKEEWDEDGKKYASDLSKEGAEALMEQEMVKQFEELDNTYTIRETDSGNRNIVINPDYKNGKAIHIKQNNSWNRGYGGGLQQEWDEVIEHPYELEIKNNYKKVKLSIKKQDGYSNDKKAHGAATLEGAVFAVFTDANCTRRAQFVTAAGKPAESEFTTDKDGKFETGYLRCGQTYYIKELKAPEGYKKNSEIKQVTLNGSDYAGEIEYRSEKKNVTIDNIPILGKVKLQKYWSDGETGEIFPEVGAVFQVYYKDKGGKNKGTYETCDDYERDTLVIGEDGTATSHDLYYGDYKIHQVSTGGKDTEKVPDMDASINEGTEGKTQTFSMDNHLFKAYLKIIKKDGNTEQTVLKAGTSYQIYRVEDGKETLVTQEYSDGHKKVKVDTFSTDESGQIMTVEPLLSGTYRIYETGAADGFHIDTPYIEIEINSGAGNYTSETDVDGNTYSVVEAQYVNEETVGKLSIKKTGEQLADYKDGRFVYEETQLKGVVFEIYADGDIATQDNQEGSTWFKDGDLAATVTTGEGAEFTSPCGGLAGYTVDDGVVTVNLPLGKYHVKEKKTRYGYILPESGWDVEFNWENKEDTYVLNATDATDENGVMNVWNERAEGQLSIEKTDAAASGTAVSGAEFGVYTKDAIYNASGEKIVDAGTKLGSITTDKDGKAETDFCLPLMSEDYKPADGGAVSGSAITVSAASGGAVTIPEEQKLNSGDYYFKEESVSGSYYLDAAEVPFHLEYKDAETPVIVEKAEPTNNQTTVEVDKTTVTGSDEVPGCELDITDKDGNVVVSWTSGDEDSVKFTDKDLGYQNLVSHMTEENHLVIGGLKHNTEYTLTERRPADGYVTADSIAFQLLESTTEKGKTLAAVKNEDGAFTVGSSDVIHMVDETTKVRFNKKDSKGKRLGGARIAVYDTNGKKITTFTTKEGKSWMLDGVLTAGQTYIFKEIKAPKGYEKAKPVRYTVWDTKTVQTVSMVDKKMGTIHTKTPEDFSEGSHSDSSPKTGYTAFMLWLLSLMGAAGGASLYAWRRVHAYGKK